MLEVQSLSVAYGDVRVLHDVSLRVGQGQIVSLVGANGAGKTTTLRAVSGLLPVLEGAVKFDGEPITGLAPSRIVERGLAHVPEGRHLFTNMTVHENLEMGAYLPRAKGSMAETMAWVTGLFPRLAERRTQLAGTLSGGEQQMLAIGRALMSRPRLLILDEPSLGPCCWSSRTSSSRCACRIAATCWRPAASCWRARAPSCWPTRTRARRSWACSTV